MSRTICWFSCGAASAVATKLTLADPTTDEVVIAYTDPGSEHADNHRFLRDCEAWFGQDVVRLRSDRYADTWAVWEGEKYLAGKHGAPCTKFLKRMVRYGFQRPDDLHVWGFTGDKREVLRAERITETDPGLLCRFPLIERSLTKQDCYAIIDRAGLELPLMYRLGYSNANCVGCVKASSFSYWNRTRRHFPETFDRMAREERDKNYAICKDAAGPVFLDELDPDRADEGDQEPEVNCGLLCELASQEIAVEMQERRHG